MNLGLVFYSQNIAKLSSFYVAALGFTREDSDETYIRLVLGETELVIHKASEKCVARLDESREHIPIKPVFFINENLDDIREAVISNGGFFKPSPAEWQFNGTVVCDGNDVEGNIFQVRCKNTD